MWNCNSKSSHFGLLLLRVVIGAFFLMAGLGKLQATPEMQEMVWWAAHLAGLTFLTKTTWFRVATYGEIVTWALLVLGLRTRIASILGFIIMLFAINMMGRNFNMMDPQNAMVPGLFALILLALAFIWWGSRSLWHVFKKKPMCGCCSTGCSCNDCDWCNQ